MRRGHLVSLSLLVFLLGGCIGNSSSKSSVTVTISPSSAQVYAGLTAKFTASVTGSSNTAVTWEADGKVGGNTSVGTITTTGLYTAPATVSSATTITITAISQADTNAKGAVTISVNPPATVAVSPAAATVASGGKQQFQAVINGTNSGAVTWSVVDSDGTTTGIGNIDSEGVYTAPFAPPATNSVVITATSTADPSQTAIANVTLVFGTGALQGQYVISTQGHDSNSAFGRVGSIVLDGEGNVTAGVEDVTVSTGTSTVLFNSGTYTVGADGRGTLGLTNNTAGTITFYLCVDSNAHASLVESDSSYTASGDLRKQDTSAFSQAGLAGSYAFDFSGVDGSAYVNSIVGRFTSDGAGHLNSGQWDQDEGNSSGHITSSGAITFSNSSYQIDSTYGSNYGRATASINSLDFVFYVVDSTTSAFLQTDFPAVLTGDAVSQQSATASLNSLSGAYVFLMSGSANNGPVERGGKFTADGAGNVTNLVLLNDYKGNIKQVPSSGSLTGTYTIDSSTTGRGALKFTDSNGANYTFIFYQMSSSDAILQDASTELALHGSLLSQTTATLSSTTFAGRYGFQWSGTNNGELDGLGQITLTSASSKNASGTFDYNDAGTLEGNLTFSGNFALSGDGTSVNTLAVAATSDSSKNFGFYALVADPNTLLLVGTDEENRPLAGRVLRQ